MSTFKVFLNNNEFDGEKLAAKLYNQLYSTFTNKTNTPTGLFEAWIRQLLGTAGVTITYSINDWPVSLDTQQRIIATPSTGRSFRLKLKSDDDNYNLRKVVMITPADKPELDAPYLADIVANIKSANQADAMAYLLGTILLRRCR